MKVCTKGCSNTALQVSAWFLLLGTVAIAGCATYHSQPLLRQQTTVKQISDLKIDASRLSLPELRAHRFDPSDGLDMIEVAMLAVANNPELRLARDDLGIARAQAFAAGLLPDPQLAFSRDYPSSPEPGMTSAFNLGLSMDVMALLTRPSTMKSADEEVRKIDLGLLWQEWQTVAQAKQLFIRVTTQERIASALEQLVAVNRKRHERTSDAVAQRNLSSDIETAVLTSLRDVQRQASEAERLRNQARHDLNKLLGLSPDVHLDLVSTSEDAEEVDDSAIEAALKNLPTRRPDLLALEAGYQSQEAKYRAAILGQFPSLSISFVRARDTSNVYTSGFQINLSLPIFNRNRGNIAIESATRQRLADDYQQRVNQAYADIDQMRIDQRSFVTQLADDQHAVARLERIAADAENAFQQRNLTVAAYADAQSALIIKKIEYTNLMQALMEQRIAMNALLGGELPTRFSLDQPQENTHAR